ncbi:MAG: septal ring lytic transglycosylase RlpA family protein [Rhodospirillales bacterium]|nr:septal ring lytic transglycosylase RlpA family protein [Rhodospirillales bacterium]
MTSTDPSMNRRLAKHLRPRRHIANVCAVLFLSLLLAACAGGSQPPASSGMGSSGGAYKIGKPYKVLGKWYTPHEDPYYDQVGIASWYGPNFQGRPTANGETFDMNTFSAAHKTLPLPSRVKVTNLDNGRSIVVRVNDRGPFVHGRIIDLSRRAAQELGFLKNGTARVRVAVVRDPVGERFVLAKATTTKAEQDSVVAAPAINVQSKPLAPPPGVASSPVDKPMLLASRARGVRSFTPSTSPISSQPINSAQTHPSAQLYVQAGAFSDLTNAHRLRDQLNGFGPVDVAPVNVGGAQYYRVRIGPMGTLDLADNALTQIINGGHPDARIIVDDTADVCRAC